MYQLIEPIPDFIANAVLMQKYCHDLGDCNDKLIPLEYFEYSYINYPVSKLLEIMTKEEWQEWWDEEMDIAKHDLDDESRWSGLLVHLPETDPCIYAEIADKRVDIWDGWHRSAAAVLRGDEFIRVVLAKCEFPPPSLKL